MTDLSKTILAKSDQLNADDLIGAPITVTIREVRGGGSNEQPISIFYEGDNNKPWKPCKGMRRVLVFCWGANGHEYVGRKLTLYRDPNVKWAGEAVGGVRISHISHIKEEMVFPLTISKGNKKVFIVKPIIENAPKDMKQMAAQIAAQLKAAENISGIDAIMADRQNTLLEIKAQSQPAYDFIVNLANERRTSFDLPEKETDPLIDALDAMPRCRECDDQGFVVMSDDTQEWKEACPSCGGN